MRDLVKTSLRRIGIGWFWVSVLFILPNCGFENTVPGSSDNFDGGAFPRSSAVFCDIEKALGRRCATTTDLAVGIRLSEAAIALNEGRTSNVGLDDSAAALAKCGGEPEAILYEGPFPQGFPVCLNCGVIGTTYQDQNGAPDANLACAARCLDFYGFVEGDEQLFVPEKPPNPAVLSFCYAHSQVSTNMPISTCFPGACNDEGTLLPSGWDDPRRFAEPVTWDHLIGVLAGTGTGFDLTRTKPFTGLFDAGAASMQWIVRGDGFVEFSASRADQSHLLGWTEIPTPCVAPCPDTDPDYRSIGFTLGLGDDGLIRLFDRGTQIVGPGPSGTFGTYTPGQRYRVRVRDNGNGTATISTARIDGPCQPGAPCTQTAIHTFARAAAYPMRVDVSLFELGATVVDARIVRIQ